MICSRIVRKVDWRKKPVTGSSRKIVSISQVLPAQRMEILRSCSPTGKVHAPAAKLPGTRPCREEAEPPGFDEAMYFAPKSREPWISSTMTNADRPRVSSPMRPAF